MKSTASSKSTNRLTNGLTGREEGQERPSRQLGRLSGRTNSQRGSEPDETSCSATEGATGGSVAVIGAIALIPVWLLPSSPMIKVRLLDRSRTWAYPKKYCQPCGSYMISAMVCIDWTILKPSKSK